MQGEPFREATGQQFAGGQERRPARNASRQEMEHSWSDQPSDKMRDHQAHEADRPPLAVAEDPAVAFSRLLAVAFSGLPGESSSHSKVSAVWNSEDVFLPQLFHKLRGFSSFYRAFDTEALYITLGLGLDYLV